MFILYLALYLIIVIIAWGFFIIARIHAVKYKNFSWHINPVTNFLTFFLLVLTIIWFVLLFFMPWVWTKQETFSVWSAVEETEKNKIQEEISWEEYY